MKIDWLDLIEKFLFMLIISLAIWIVVSFVQKANLKKDHTISSSKQKTIQAHVLRKDFELGSESGKVRWSNYSSKVRLLNEDKNFYIIDFIDPKTGSRNTCFTIKNLYNLVKVGDDRTFTVTEFFNDQKKLVYCQAF